MTTDRELARRWWSEAWDAGLWAASWSKSLEGLTPEEAAWWPQSAAGVAGRRHSIWQIVLHMIFWRESWLRRAATGKEPTKDEVAAGNFQDIPELSQDAWDRDRRRFDETQRRVGEALANPVGANEPLMYFLPHDMYHFGQINYLRAMLGHPPIE
jgi:uncharacterized damage-inducible protein DinB